MLFIAPNVILAANPAVSTFSPVDGGDGFGTNANLVITFDQSVTATTTGKYITIKNSSDDSTFEAMDVASSTISGSGSAIITINPTSDLSHSISYYVQIDANAFYNSGNEYFAGINDTTTWNFTTSSGGSRNKRLETPPSPTLNIVLGGNTATTYVTYSGNDVMTDKVGFTYENDGDKEDVSFGNAPSNFRYLVRNLSCGADYTFVAYAKNSVDTSYSDEIEVSTEACPESADESTDEASAEEETDSTEKTSNEQQIADLLAQVQILQNQLSQLSGPTSSCTFTGDMTIGSTGTEVTCLQKYLQGMGYFTFANGATGYFGLVTQQAVAKWQTASDVNPASGYFGPISQAKYVELVSSN